MSNWEVLLQQLIIGLSNGMIIALLALGYTMVYGIVELINFAHGDLFMLGAFFVLTLISLSGLSQDQNLYSVFLWLPLFLVLAASFTAAINWAVERYAYRPLRNAPRLAPLVSALGVSFIFLNLGLFWGALPLDVFNGGTSGSAPKDVPALISGENLFGTSNIQFSARELLVFVVTIPMLLALRVLVMKTTIGKAMRAVAQNPRAARLMGINVDRVISFTFVLGGALAGVASVVYSFYINSVHFQMGFRVGIDAFTAAVLGGIGNLSGALFGGLLIGCLRAMSDQYISTDWTNVVVFSVLIVVLIFRPNGLLGVRLREKV